MNENINFDENDDFIDLDEHDNLNESENDDDLDEHVTVNVNQNASLNKINDLNKHNALNENIDLSVLDDLNEYEKNGDALNIFDPRTLDNIDNKTKYILIENGPLRENKDECHRHFSCTDYTRKLPNGENQDRKWLTYSKNINNVYCLCCKLFKSAQNNSLFANDDVDDWKRLSERLRKNENSLEHINNMRTWIDLQIRLKKNETIDKELQGQIKKENEHWKCVLVRIISVVKCLAKRSLAFRGENEKIY